MPRCFVPTFAPIELETSTQVAQAQQPAHMTRHPHQVGQCAHEHQGCTHAGLFAILRFGNANRNFMSPFALHTVKTAVYLICASVGGLLGWATANLLSSLLPVPAGVFFPIVCILAGLLLGFVAPLEQRLIWGRLFKPIDADLAWIGRSSGSSTLLTGSIAAPCSLGFALGMLSLLMG